MGFTFTALAEMALKILATLMVGWILINWLDDAEMVYAVIKGD
jgi:hypothetical protein